MASIKKQPKKKVSMDNADYEKYQPPWAEWNDNFVNNVPWGGKLDNKYSQSPASHPASPATQNDDPFEDPAGLIGLPKDIIVKSWIRPHQMNSSVNFVLEPDSSPIDLLTHNEHLVNIKIMRMIMASIMCLERESFHRPFPVEFQSENFVATFGPYWKPWYHVYCNSRLGKGNTHTMQYSGYGKYLVRLFYQGKWRCLVVDDRLPMSQEGLLLLPISRPNNLWLPILTKALLRVAALSWEPSNQCVDFSVIHCLTGWIPTVIPSQDYTTYKAWCICCHLMASTEEVVRRPGCCECFENYQCPDDDLADGVPATDSQAIFSVVLYPALSRPRQELATSVNTLEYIFLISNVRYNNELPSPLWKEYRWKEWAFNKGIISESTDKPVRNVQIFNPFDISNMPLWSQANITEEREYWIDFDVFITYVRYLEVYYKPSYFKYSLRVWNVSGLLASPIIADDAVVLRQGRKESQSKQDKRSSKSKFKSPKSKTTKTEKSLSVSSSKSPVKKAIEKSKNPENVLKKNPTIDIPSNHLHQQFFYLLIDSMISKQLCICLSTYDSEKPPYAHLIAGKFEWHSPSVAPIVFMLSTSATKGYMLSLTPGLHVFRIWYSFPEHFCCQIFCNTPFSTGLKMSIQRALTYESSSYTFYGSKTSSTFNQLLNAPEGGAEHGKAYNEFISCLLPLQLSRQLPWPKWFTAYTEITQAFEDSLSEMLADSTVIPEEVYLVLGAYRKLFLNPTFGNETLRCYRPEYYNYIEERRLSARDKEMLLEEGLKENRKGSKEPKPLKSKDKKTPKKSEPSIKTKTSGKQKGDKKGKMALGMPMRTLLQCKEKSLLLGDCRHAIVLLKKMMTKVPHLREYYPFIFEDDRKVVFRDYTGDVKIKDSWVVLVRCILNIHSTDPVPCSLHIWASINGLVMNLINNDTHEDVPLGYVENSVADLTKNQDGYTLVVYGTANSSTVTWCLRSMGVAEEKLLHICAGHNCSNLHTQLPEQDHQTISGYYVPNKEKIIARCLLEVLTNVTVLLRFHLSNKFAICSFMIFDDLGNHLVKTTGIGNILIPILKLKGIASASSVGWQDSNDISTRARTYKIEVRLPNGSWPLNVDQIKAMLYYKENLPDIHFLLNDIGDQQNSSVLRQSLLESSDYAFFKSVETPKWGLTVVTDLQQVMPVQLCHDISLFHQLQMLRTEWNQEDFDLTQCQQLRLNIKKDLSEGREKDWSEEEVFHLKTNRTDQLAELYACPPGVSLVELASSLVLEPSVEDNVVSSPILSLTSSSQQELGRTKSAAKLFNKSSIETVWVSQSSKHSFSHSVKSTVSKLVESTSKSPVTLPKEGSIQSNLLGIQQAGIHKALEKMRIQNMEYVKQLLEESEHTRLNFIIERKAAIVAESKNLNTNESNKVGKNTPNEKKGQKKSLAGVKSKKSVKGK